MSAAVYREPYRLPAGLLAVAMHGAFFALLYFGFSWQTQPAATMSVELWQDISGEPVAAPPKPVVKETAPPEPQEAAKPEIVLPDKKKVEVKPLPKSAAKKPDTSIVDRQFAIEQAGRAERAAAAGRTVDKYTGMIAARIRSRIVMPPGVADDARAVFVLEGGYDTAVVREGVLASIASMTGDVVPFDRLGPAPVPAADVGHVLRAAQVLHGL